VRQIKRLLVSFLGAR